MVSDIELFLKIAAWSLAIVAALINKTTRHWAAGALYVLCVIGRMYSGLDHLALSHLCLIGQAFLIIAYLFYLPVLQNRMNDQRRNGNRFQGVHDPGQFFEYVVKQ